MAVTLMKTLLSDSILRPTVQSDGHQVVDLTFRESGVKPPWKGGDIHLEYFFYSYLILSLCCQRLPRNKESRLPWCVGVSLTTLGRADPVVLHLSLSRSEVALIRNRRLRPRGQTLPNFLAISQLIDRSASAPQHLMRGGDGAATRQEPDGLLGSGLGPRWTQ